MTLEELQPKKILLINPTRYLGNLLIAGDLIAHYSQWAKDRNIRFKVLIDTSYRELLLPVLGKSCLLNYPRRELKQAKGLNKVGPYLEVISQLRSTEANLAFTIEEDTVAQRLTQFCGADFKLGCSSRHGLGFDEILPIDYTKRSLEKQHRWYSFAEVFQALGMSLPAPNYLDISVHQPDPKLIQDLAHWGLQFPARLAFLHPGATKKFKLWPAHHFASVIQVLQEQGFKCVILGAGADQVQVNKVLEALPPYSAKLCVDLCNRLTLTALASLLQLGELYLGNDSGPAHLAAAAGLKGAMIFGPTNTRVWGPLQSRKGNALRVIKNATLCEASCTREQCPHKHQCLEDLSPSSVLEVLFT